MWELHEHPQAQLASLRQFNTNMKHMEKSILIEEHPFLHQELLLLAQDPEHIPPAEEPL